MDSFLNAILFIKKKKPEGSGLAQMGAEELAKHVGKMALKRVMWMAIISVGGTTIMVILVAVVIGVVFFGSNWAGFLWATIEQFNTATKSINKTLNTVTDVMGKNTYEDSSGYE